MKKFIAMMLAVLMLATMLTACGGGGNETSNPAANDGNAAIKLGMCGPLTGGASVYGTAVKAGMEIAVEEINALGGLQFELMSQDDEHDGEKAVNAYNTLKDDGMQIFVGTVTSVPAQAVAPMAAEDGIFMLTPSASADKILEAGDNVFQVCFKDTNQGFASANYFAKKFADKAIGIIYDSSDLYSTGITANFQTQGAANGLNIVCAEAFTADNKADLSTQVTKCQEAGAEVVFLPFYAVEAAQVLTYANKIGYTPVFFGCDGMDGILTTDGFDPALAEGLMMLTPFSADSSDAATQAFVAKYQEKTGIVPNQFAADAYDVVYALYQACNNAGVTANMSTEDITAAMIAQFTSMTFDGLTGAGMTWDETGAVSKEPMAVVIENGVYVGVE